MEIYRFSPLEQHFSTTASEFLFTGNKGFARVLFTHNDNLAKISGKFQSGKSATKYPNPEIDLFVTEITPLDESRLWVVRKFLSHREITGLIVHQRDCSEYIVEENTIASLEQGILRSSKDGNQDMSQILPDIRQDLLQSPRFRRYTELSQLAISRGMVLLAYAAEQNLSQRYSTSSQPSAAVIG